MELGSASAAAREKAAELHEFAYGPAHRQRRRASPSRAFRAPKGWVFPYADANVLFTQGRCLMLVGDDLTTKDNKLPAAAATHAIWARTAGKPGALRDLSGSSHRRATPATGRSNPRRSARVHPGSSIRALEQPLCDSGVPPRDRRSRSASPRALHEGRETWRGEGRCAPAPISGLDSVACGDQDCCR
jgi:hypothetical protein